MGVAIILLYMHVYTCTCISGWVWPCREPCTYPEHDDVVAAVTLQNVEGGVEAGTGQEVVSLKPRAEVITCLAKLEAERELQPLGLPTTDI